MPQNIASVKESVSELSTLLQEHRSLSVLGSVLTPFRSEELMRNLTFKNHPIDCLLFGVAHLEDNQADLKQAMAWLNQAQSAYKDQSDPTIWQMLAEAVRLDVMIQLNGLRLAHTAKLRNELLAKMSESAHHRDDAKFQKTAKELQGLLGYHLGHGLEMTDSTLAVYDQALKLTNDDNLKLLVEKRKQALTNCAYLTASDFRLSNDEFNAICHNREGLQSLVRNLCTNGQLPARPNFNYEIRDSVLKGALLTVFAPPVALIAIPAALVGSPVFMVMDHINYSSDQTVNMIYYKILDDANAWTERYIQQQANNTCQSLAQIKNSVTMNINELALKKSHAEYYSNIKGKLDAAKKELNYRERYFTYEEKTQLNSEIAALEMELRELAANCHWKNVTNAIDTGHNIAEYLANEKLQAKHADNKYHPQSYQEQTYANVSLNDTPAILNGLNRQLDDEWKSLDPKMQSVATRVSNLAARIKQLVADKMKALEVERHAAANLTNIANQYKF